MVQEMQFYNSLDQPHNWKSSAQQLPMNTQMSHSIVPQSGYSSANYNYSPTMFHSSSFPYNNRQIPTISNNISSNYPQDFQGFPARPYSIDQGQYNNTPHNVNPSGSSTADSNGSIVSEFDLNRNPIKKRRKPAPTIATGRRNLKEENVNTEEADRRDKRRERNRKSAQRCRERKMEKKDVLEQQISDTNHTCSKYIELAENVLKAWKQRLHLLNEKLPCNNYKSQLSVSDFESLIELMHGRNKETRENNDSCGSLAETSADFSNNQEFSLQHLDTATINSSKMEPYYPAYSDINGILNSGFDQYHNCVPESKIGYM